MKKILFAALALCTFFNAPAQQSAIYLDAERGYRNGLELFNKQKYVAAQKEFDAVTLSKENISVEAKTDAEYYAAICAVELYSKDAEWRLTNFILNHPESRMYERALFETAKFHYKLKRWKKAIEWFDKSDKTLLTKEEHDEYYFKRGYAFYMMSDFEKAGAAFFEVKDGDSKYASASQYYYAHMMYMNKNYETALQSFLKLKNSEAFAPVAPYYITQIYFLQGKYDELLKYAPPLLDSNGTKNGLEIGRMIGESHYRKGNYKEAIPYVFDYTKSSGGATRSDDYVLAYCYYRTGACEKAIPVLQNIINVNDSLTQYAYYHLADCFIKSNKKQSARNAFQSAGKLKYNAEIQEESQFNYAKLSFELNFGSVAIESFRNFQKNFPRSVHAEEVNELLVGMYASTKNYKDALTAIESIKNKSENIKAIYQRVAYYRGVQLYMDNKPKDAIDMFNTSLKNPSETKLIASATYWKGESQFKLNNYDDAIKSYSDFLFTPAAFSLSYYNVANYNVGYSNFKKENWADAQTAFRKYIKEKNQTDGVRYNDALLRIADSFFMLKDQANAMDYYNQAIDNKAKSSDYALYQKAVIQGIQGKLIAKAATLENIFKSYPKSVYFDDALYESGNANMLSGNNEAALINYKKLITDFPSSSYVKKAMLGQALVYYNNKQDEASIKAYKDLIAQFPNTPESKEALAQLRNIAVSQNKVEDYLAYTKNIPNADVSIAGQDSLIYESAELRYTQGNCDEAVRDFENYLQKFPEGTFAVNANYYTADCHYRSKQYEQAIVGYEYVLKQSKNNFTEKSLLYAGLINYRMKQYAKSLEDFEKLESTAEVKENIVAAQAGQMRSAFKLSQYDNAIVNARKIINGTVEDKDLIIEAHLIYAKSALAKEDYSTAKSEFQIVAKRTNTEMTAESNYSLAWIEYRLGNYKESKDIIFDIQKQVPSYDFWIAKGFILLGDNYLAQSDTFQAKETYKSILENYQKDPNDAEDLRAVAQEKFGNILSSEEIKNKEMIEQKMKLLPVENDSLDEKK